MGVKKEIAFKIIYFILVIIWMIIVFFFSAENGKKSTNTSNIVTKSIVEVTNKKKTKSEKEKMIAKIDPYIRKFAHFILYTVGGFLIINFIKTILKDKNRQVVLTILIGFVYAITDEVHQYFISERAAEITDVIIDTTGIMVGIGIFIIILKIIKRIKNNRDGGVNVEY